MDMVTEIISGNSRKVTKGKLNSVLVLLFLIFVKYIVNFCWLHIFS